MISGGIVGDATLVGVNVMGIWVDVRVAIGVSGTGVRSGGGLGVALREGVGVEVGTFLLGNRTSVGMGVGVRRAPLEQAAVSSRSKTAAKSVRRI